MAFSFKNLNEEYFLRQESTARPKRTELYYFATEIRKAIV